MYLWFSDQELKQLLDNGQQTQRGDDISHTPVVKLFTPDANCTWLLTDIVPPEDEEDPELAFGLCDLGLGFPELGYVSLTELHELRGNADLPVEKDNHFEATAPIEKYAEAARRESRIVENL